MNDALAHLNLREERDIYHTESKRIFLLIIVVKTLHFNWIVQTNIAQLFNKNLNKIVGWYIKLFSIVLSPKIPALLQSIKINLPLWRSEPHHY